MDDSQININQAEYMAKGNKDSAENIRQNIEAMHNSGVSREGMVVENNQVIDVVDLINDSGSNAIAIRIKTLLENGITEQMIEEKYLDISSGVANKEIALDNMRSVCDMLIKYLSDIPNGIVINEVTGEIDKEKSLQSAVECGILSEQDVLIIDPMEQVFEVHKKTTLTEILANSKLFKEEDKDYIRWNYNQRLNDELDYFNRLYSLIDNSTNLQEINEIWGELANEVAPSFGQTEEQWKNESEMLSEFKAQSIEDLNLTQIVFYLCNKGPEANSELINKMISKYKTSKFYELLLDENGEIDLQKLQEFKENWTERNNRANLKSELTKYLMTIPKDGSDFEELDDVHKMNIKILLARGFFAEDESNKNAFNNLCKRLKIGNDLYSILEITGYHTMDELEQVKKDHDINDKNYRNKISDMKKLRRMTHAEKMVSELTENIKLHNSDEAEAIARLYVMYSKKANEYDKNSIEEKKYRGISNTLRHYILHNKEYFSEYMTYIKNDGKSIKNKLEYARVVKVLKEKEPSRRTNSVLKSLSAKIERGLEDRKIPEEELIDFFYKSSEEICISYKKEKSERKDKKEMQLSDYYDENMSDSERSIFYRPDNVTDMGFAQAMIFFSNKDYRGNKELLNGIMAKYRDSKYYAIILDENGDVDIEKLKEFSEAWVEEHNKDSLKKDLVTYLKLANDENLVFEELDDVTKANLRSILARGFLTDDNKNRYAFNKLCQYLQIGNDLEGILKATGCKNLGELEEIKQDYDINSRNYHEQISNMKIASTMTYGEKMIFELSERLDLHEETDRDAIARLYLMYCEKSKESPKDSMDAKMYGRVATAIEQYMLTNKEHYSEYMTAINYSGNIIRNKVDYEHVKKVLNKKETPRRTGLLVRAMGNMIENTLSNIKESDKEKSNELFKEFFDERTEDIAIGYREEKTERIKEHNRRLADKRKKAMDSKITSENNVDKKSESGSQPQRAKTPQIKMQEESQESIKDKKQNPFLVWIRESVDKVSVYLKKIILKDDKRNAGEIKLLEEANSQEAINQGQQNSITGKKGFVQIVEIDHQRALDATRNSERRSQEEVVEEAEVNAK